MILPVEPGLRRRNAYGEYVRFQNHQRGRQRNRYSHYNPFALDTELYLRSGGLSLSQLQNTSEIILAKDAETCVVCLDEIRPEKDILRNLICGHDFHVKCIDKWFVDHSCCPLCKRNFE
jgi:hypothetical protein